MNMHRLHDATCSKAAARSSSASRSPAALDRCARARERRTQAARAHRGRFFPGDRRQGHGHGLFRQSRSRHRRRDGAAADRRRRARCAAAHDQARPGRHRAYARAGQDLGQPVDPDRRHADAQCRGDRQKRVARGGRQAARRRARRSSRSRTASSRPATSASPMASSSAARSFCAQARPHQARRRQGPEGLQARRQAGAARRHPGQGDRAFTYMQDFRVPGMLHGRVVRPPAIRRAARERRRELDQGRRRRGQGGARGQFPRRGRRERVGRRSRRRGSSRRHGRNRKTLPDAGKLCGARARDQGGQGRGDQQCRQHRRGAGARRREGAQGDLRFCHPYPRLDRAVVRGGGVQGRQAHLVVGLAGDARSAQAARRRCSRMPAENVRCLYIEGSGCYGRNGHEDAAGRRGAARQSGRQARCACNGRAPTSTAGTRRARPRSSTCARPWTMPATSRPGNRNSSFRSRRPAVSSCRSSPRRSRGMPQKITSRPATSFRTRRSPTNSPM